MGLAINKLCCMHCGEENPNYFQFGSMDIINPQAKMMNNMMGNSYEWTPKIPAGFYFYCSKCKKHTVILPDKYSHRELDNTIPQQIIFSPVYQEPEISATSYILYNSGMLDQIVTTKSGTLMSLITRQPIVNDGSWREIDKGMYELCLSRGFQEVRNETKSTTNQSIGSDNGTTGEPIYKPMEQYVGATTTTNVSPISTNDSTTNNTTTSK